MPPPCRCCLVCRQCPLQPASVPVWLQGVALGRVPSLHRSGSAARSVVSHGLGGLPQWHVLRGLPRRKKGCVPLCAPMVDRGKVERERGVTAANLATAFSLLATMCPLTSFCNLIVCFLLASGAPLFWLPFQRPLMCIRLSRPPTWFEGLYLVFREGFAPPPISSYGGRG